MTGGLGAIIAGGMLVGGGSSFITNPIAKKISGERMAASELASDVALGTVIGVASGGLGAGGTALAKGATTATKVAIQIGAGATTGAVGGALGETTKAIKGEEVSVGSFAKAIGVGVTCGAVGGASGQVASAITKNVSSGTAIALTRITAQAATSGLTDTTLQVIENDGELSVHNNVFY